jgi:hypothetical protein
MRVKFTSVPVILQSLAFSNNIDIQKKFFVALSAGDMHPYYLFPAALQNDISKNLWIRAVVCKE